MTKFYHYNVWVEGEDGNRLDLNDAFDSEIFEEDNHEISRDRDKFYFTRFQMIRSGNYHGMLMRAKDENGFIRLNEENEMGVLSEETEGEGRTGSLDRDYVNFAVKMNRKTMNILLEVGYQTPGILKIKEYLNHHIDTDISQIGHESRMPDLDKERLQNLLEKDLKVAKISFKKHPKNIVGLSAKETLQNSIPDEYKLKLRVSIEQGADESLSVREYLNDTLPDVFDSNEEIPENIKQIDFAKAMHTFKLTGYDQDNDAEEEEKRI